MISKEMNATKWRRRNKYSTKWTVDKIISDEMSDDTMICDEMIGNPLQLKLLELSPRLLQASLLGMYWLTIRYSVSAEYLITRYYPDPVK